MALDKQLVPISFNDALDTKTDSKQVVPGKLLILENAVMTSVGKFQKRNGFTTIASGTTLSSGNAITTYNNELIMLDGTNVYSYSSQENKKNSKGVKTTIDLSVNSIIQNDYQQTAPDSAYLSNLAAFVWCDSSGGVRYSISDTATNQNIISNVLISATGYSPKVKGFGTNFVITYVESNILKYKSVSTTTPTILSSATSIDTLLTTYWTYDIQLISTKLFIAYTPTTAANIYFRTLDSSLTLSSALHVAVADSPNAICIFGDASNNVWVGYNISYASYYLIRDFVLSGTPVLAPTKLYDYGGNNFLGGIAGVFNSANNQATFYFEGSGDAGVENEQRYIIINTATISGSVGVGAVFLRSVGLASKPFVYNSTIYLAVQHFSSLQSTTFIINGSGNVVSKVAYGTSGLIGGFNNFSSSITPFLNHSILPEFNAISGTVFQLAYLLNRLIATVGGQVTTLSGVSSASFTFGIAAQTNSLGNNLHITGGVLSMYDGAKSVEHGFHLYPEDVTVETSVIGGTLGRSQYQFCQTYEWTDNKGQIHRSAPSVAQTVNLDPTVAGAFVAQTGATGTSGNSYITSKTNNIVRGQKIQVFEINADSSYGNELTAAGTTVTVVDPAAGQVSLSANLVRTQASSSPGCAVIVTPQYIFTGATKQTQNVLVISQIASLFTVCDFTNGSSTIQARNPSNLAVGMTLLCDSAYGPTGAIITAISGNNITLNSTASATYVNQTVQFIIKSATGVVTNTSAVITGVEAAVIAMTFVGQQLNAAGGIDTGATVSSFTATTITMNKVATGSGTGFIAYHHGTSQLIVGQVINGTGIPTNSIITSIRDYNSTVPLNPPDIITIDNAATATGSNISITTTTVSQVTPKTPTLRLTDKTTSNSLPILCSYRTLANQTTFYKSSSLTAPTYNDLTVDSKYVFDSVSDYILTGNELLYTNGGEVENIAIPATSSIVQYKNRLMGIASEDPLSLWYSKEVIEGSPVEFSDLLVQRIEESGGQMYSGRQMDDKLILFKKSSIYFMAGNGPAPSGANNDFSTPQQIPVDVGCSNPKSIVLAPTGIFFQSSKGIYLLTRGLGIEYIGAPVEAFNSYTVTSAKLVDGVTQIRFTMSSGDTLVYDYYVNKWYVFKNVSAIDSTIYNSLHTLITSAGVVKQESIGTFTDDASPILIKILTGWLSFAKLQGFQRVYGLLVLGDYKSAHTLTITTYENFASASVQSTPIAVGSAPTIYQYRMQLGQQKCQSIQFLIQETQSPTYGEGLSLSALTLQVGIKRGPFKVSAASSYGS